MKSRHTTMRGKLTRSFGIADGEDYVVELNEDGYITFRREPADRKLRRREEVPSVRLHVSEVCADLTIPKGDVESILEQIARRVPIADFSEETSPHKIPYKVKVWLMNALKEITAPPETEE